MKNLVKYRQVLSDDMNCSTEELLGLEIECLINDCCDIINCIYVYGKISDEDFIANTIVFNSYYIIIRNALAYRVVIGLSKIFDSNSKARTLRKIINIISQKRDYNTNLKIKSSICKLLNVDAVVKQSFDFKELRDKFFAHLDKEVVLSSLRIGYELYHLSEIVNLMKELIFELQTLYELCFNKECVKIKVEEFELPDVRELNDFEERAKRFIEQNKTIGKCLKLDSDGLHFSKR